MSAATDSPGLPSISSDIVLTFGHIAWNIRQYGIFKLFYSM